MGQYLNTTGTSLATTLACSGLLLLLNRTTTFGCPFFSITNWCLTVGLEVCRMGSSRGSVLKCIFSFVLQPICLLSLERLKGEQLSRRLVASCSWLVQITSEESCLKLSLRLMSLRLVRVSRSLSLICVWLRLFSGEGLAGSSRLRLARRNSRLMGSSMPQCSQMASMYSRSMRLLNWLQ